MRHLPFCSSPVRRLWLLLVVLGVGVLAPAEAGAQSLDEIASLIDREGRYLEVELQPVAEDSVDRANAQGIAFVRLDQENAEDLPIIASGLLERLEGASSSYRTIIVLDASGVWVQSLDGDTSAAADAALPQFANGAVAGGIDTVVASLSGQAVEGAEQAADDESGADAPTDPEATGGDPAGSSGGGVPWLLIILLGAIAFFAVRFVTGRRRKAAAVEAELAEDRAEIREQLRNNSDHVIGLGERIADADDELRRMYEEAAQTYQDVSLGLDDATTAAEIDALDDRLDRAEWLFEVIEARLDGRTPPAEPTPGEGPVGRPPGRQPVPPLGDRGRTPPPPGPRRPTGRSGRSDGPALGPDESLFPDGTGRRRTPQRRAPSRRTGGGLGGILGGAAKTGLLALVMRLLLGGGLSLGNTSRRSQQRRGGGFGGTSRGGGLGGGVLRGP